MERDLMACLAQHRALGGAPVHEHAWLAAHGVRHTYATGAVVNKKGELVPAMLIVLEGHVVIRVDRGAGSHKMFEWRGGDVGGAMPYSRGASPPNDAVAEEPTTVLEVEKELFAEVVRECPAVTTTLVHIMVDRARHFTSSDLRDEKLISLGKLAAGLAHELNNPASAVMRSAKMLAEGLTDAEAAARRLAEVHLAASQFARIEATRSACSAAPGTAGLSAIARADREDAIADWLAEHGAEEEHAVPLAEAGITLAALDTLAEYVAGDALEAGLRWVTACCLVRALTSEIETAAGRISHLVGAMKGFSYMDHAPIPEPVDVRRGITDTLTMLEAKTRSKSVHVSLDLAADLPRAHAVGAGLNQMWMNLIDNAIDAVAVGGHVAVTAAPGAGSIVVSVIDDGPGIPPEIQGHIFDPFFTTKGVGEGTGLGLDIVRRLVQQHEGEIGVESRPGRTEFQVRLPAEALSNP